MYGQCIASTTLDEHRTHFEKDKALARRFQPVFINESSQVMLGLLLLQIIEDSRIQQSFPCGLIVNYSSFHYLIGGCCEDFTWSTQEI